MSLGIGVLYKREKLKIDNLPSPFYWNTWLCLIGIYLCKIILILDFEMICDLT
jgi:hypothetical protein